MHITRLSEGRIFGPGQLRNYKILPKALKIQGFAVEMTLRERIDRTRVTSSYPTPRSLETRTERGFPHSHSDGCPGGSI